MEKVTITNKDLAMGLTLILLFLIISMGFGYFFGSYDQLQKSKARLEVIPDVNCGTAKPALH